MTYIQLVIYHNPECSKSRRALELLRQSGVKVEVIEYLKTPMDVATVNRLLDLLEIPPHALLRTGEDEYAALKLTSTSSREEIVRAIVAHPILMERPVVVYGERAIIGRPPEKVIDFLK